jgi:hypothetical protein
VLKLFDIFRSELPEERFVDESGEELSGKSAME